jgi:hypothetical protein
MKVSMTAHAIERANEMEVSYQRLSALVSGAVPSSMDYPSGKRYPGARVAVGDGLAVPYRIESGVRVVITVLWDGKEAREQVLG